ncbi:MAG: hypothetical protein CM1200mP34_4530 [Verrucomicrobiales bacterium]|nr:MAG: hypothetical protein CM1200mP34_4530 [Verrucomicrobiales bacterium]
MARRELPNVLEFPDRHDGTQVFKIETNYRSTPEILTRQRRHAGTRTVREGACAGARLRHEAGARLLQRANQQAEFIAQRVLELRDEGTPLEGMAVLPLALPRARLQMEFTRRDIPFVLTSGIRFFEQAHVKDVAAYLKLLVNPGENWLQAIY